MKFKTKIMITFISIGISCSCFGQGPAGGGPPGLGGASDPPCWPPPCIAIDGGIGFLIAIGAAFGGKKVYDSLRKKE